MSEGSESALPEELREQVLAAAYDELARWGIDRFSVVALADRHGLDHAMILRHWQSPEELILEVLLGWPGEDVATPDTGSLRTDLLALATAMARYVESERGHSLQATHLIGNRNLSSTDVRRTAWRARSGRLRVVIDRAEQRGDLIEGVDALTVLELVFAPINMRALFTGQPVDDQYCRTVSELVWRAIARP
ncbi:MAG: TetR/AcrR family transcriptional regulator C-terminal ligand-binding domain-containing protein [Actinobacteria bacterium]|nr:TetR/AcrR family transcriptional regulator C-terminal ligand-binding domain-containing protein [Actinomycetota bacterium]